MAAALLRVRTYSRRRPEEGVLYQVLAEWLETFLLTIDLDESRNPLPGFVRSEFRAYLDCGILAKGFLCA